MSHLAGRHLRFAIVEYAPYTVRSSAGEWSGVSVDLLRLVAVLANFTFELRDSALFGVPYMVNGSERWNGMIGMVHRNEADAAVSIISNLESRRRVVDFSFPIDRTECSVLVGFGAGQEVVSIASHWHKAFAVYSWEVWLGVLVTAALICGCAFAVEKIMRSPARLHELLFVLYRIWTSQADGTFTVTRSQSAKCTALLWALLCTIFISLYPAQLVGMFSVRPPWHAPFSTLAQMDELGYRLLVHGESATHLALKKIADGNGSNAARMQRMIEPTNLNAIWSSLAEKPRTVAFVESDSFWRERCVGVAVPLSDEPALYPLVFNSPFAFSKGSALERVFDPLLLRLINDDRLWKPLNIFRHRKQYENRDACRIAADLGGGMRRSGEPLALSNVVSPLFLLFVALTIAGVVLLLEVIYDRAQPVAIGSVHGKGPAAWYS